MRSAAAVIRSRFYPLIGFMIAAVIVMGFARTFYLRFLYDLPPLKSLVLAHGVVFTAWLALFLAQARLIAKHRYGLHKKLGIAGAVLAAAVVSIGVVTALAAAAIPRPRPMGFDGYQFLIFPLFGIVAFGVCVAAAIALRKRADLHKRLMLLGMIAVLGPGVARLIRLAEMGDAFLWIQTGVTFVFVTWALLHDWYRNRMLHPVFAIGGAILVVSWPLRAFVAGSGTWVSIARWLTT